MKRIIQAEYWDGENDCIYCNVEYVFRSGRLGTHLDPPEPDEVDITELTIDKELSPITAKAVAVIKSLSEIAYTAFMTPIHDAIYKNYFDEMRHCARERIENHIIEAKLDQLRDKELGQ